MFLQSPNWIVDDDKSLYQSSLAHLLFFLHLPALFSQSNLIYIMFVLFASRSISFLDKEYILISRTYQLHPSSATTCCPNVTYRLKKVAVLKVHSWAHDLAGRSSLINESSHHFFKEKNYSYSFCPSKKTLKSVARVIHSSKQ
jgi:hypothetical protein